MGIKLSHSQSVTATGEYAIAFGAAPLGGFNAQASLGTATSATVKLLVRTHANATYILADTLNLTNVSPQNSLNTPIYPPYEEAKWEVTAIAGGTLILTAVGVGA
jgi:hypothetical protein